MLDLWHINNIPVRFSFVLSPFSISQHNTLLESQMPYRLFLEMVLFQLFSLVKFLVVTKLKTSLLKVFCYVLFLVLHTFLSVSNYNRQAHLVRHQHPFRSERRTVEKWFPTGRHHQTGSPCHQPVREVQRVRLRRIWNWGLFWLVCLVRHLEKVCKNKNNYRKDSIKRLGPYKFFKR